jgi:hypothetical protein
MGLALGPSLGPLHHLHDSSDIWSNAEEGRSNSCEKSKIGIAFTLLQNQIQKLSAQVQMLQKLTKIQGDEIVMLKDEIDGCQKY